MSKMTENHQNSNTMNNQNNNNNNGNSNNNNNDQRRYPRSASYSARGNRGGDRHGGNRQSSFGRLGGIPEEAPWQQAPWYVTQTNYHYWPVQQFFEPAAPVAPAPPVAAPPAQYLYAPASEQLPPSVTSRLGPWLRNHESRAPPNPRPYPPPGYAETITSEPSSARGPQRLRNRHRLHGVVRCAHCNREGHESLIVLIQTHKDSSLAVHYATRSPTAGRHVPAATRGTKIRT